MQTFLPDPDFVKTAQCLDYKRLGKQRLEAKEIYLNLTRHHKGWIHHPAIKMWEGYQTALKMYYNCILSEWIKRGYKNTMEYFEIAEGVIEIPPFIGNKCFHDSHKSNLLRKDPEYYKQFNWNVPNDIPYVWIVSNDRGCTLRKESVMNEHKTEPQRQALQDTPQNNKELYRSEKQTVDDWHFAK